MDEQGVTLTSAEVAELLGVTAQTVGRWAVSGKLPPSFRTIGGHRRYFKAYALARAPVGDGRRRKHPAPTVTEP